MRLRIVAVLVLTTAALLAAGGQASAADSHSQTRTVGAMKRPS